MRSVSWSLPLHSFLILFFLLSPELAVSSQQPTAEDSEAGMALYQALVKFDLSSGTARAENVVLKRDRVEMTFDGMFYFEAPIGGRIHGAVFLGRGNVHAAVPNSVFERDNLYRMLKADAVDSTFSNAVLRFSDDTVDALGLKISPAGTPPAEALKLASELSPVLLRDTGANVAARLLVSILNKESPGFFLAQFDRFRKGEPLLNVVDKKLGY